MKIKLLIALMLILPLPLSLEVIHPEEESYLSGNTEIEALTADEEVTRVDFYWWREGFEQWNKIGSATEDDEYNGSYRVDFDTSKAPDSSNVLLRASSVKCESRDKGSICWVSETDLIKNLTIDNTPPRILDDPWLLIDGLGGKLSVKLQATIVDDLTAIEEINKPIVRKEGNEYTLGFGGTLKNLAFNASDKAGNTLEYSLNFTLSNNTLTALEESNYSSQVFQKEDTLKNTGEQKFQYYITHADLEDARALEGLSFTGFINPEESKTLRTIWKGDMVETDQDPWVQDLEEESTPDIVHFKTNVSIRASETLPKQINITYMPREDNLFACSNIDLEEKLVELSPGQDKVITIKSSADCIEGFEVFEWKHSNYSEELIIEYSDIVNNFQDTLEVTYKLPEDELPDMYECVEDCEKTLSTYPEDSMEVEFYVERKDELTSEKKLTGQLVGVLGGSTVRSVLLGLAVLVALVVVLYFARKRTENEEQGL